MKKISRLLVLSGLILSFTGCGNDYTEPLHIENEPLHIEDEYKNNSLIKKEITDHINICANLSFPECKDYYITDALLTYPEQERVIDNFFDGEDYKIIDKKYLHSEYHDVGYTVEDSEKYIGGSCDGTVYFKGEVNLSYDDILKTSLDDDAYCTMHLYVKETAELFSESYIDDFKKKGCKQKAVRFMEKLGLTDYYDENPEIIVMDKKNMDKVIKTAKIQNDAPSEGYIFIYRRTLFGLPMYDSSYPSNVGKSATNGCFCIIELYKDGNIFLDARGVYKIGEKKKTEIIKPDSVLDKIEAKYGEIISEADITIDEISLRYLPLKLKIMEANFEIRPAWIIHVKESGDFVHYYYSAIDAVSGDWLF